MSLDMELTLPAELHSLDSQITGNFAFALSMGQTISHFSTDNCTLETHLGWHSHVSILCLGKDRFRHRRPSSSQLNTATSPQGSEGIISRVLRGKLGMDVDRKSQ